MPLFGVERGASKCKELWSDFVREIFVFRWWWSDCLLEVVCVDLVDLNPFFFTLLSATCRLTDRDEAVLWVVVVWLKPDLEPVKTGRFLNPFRGGHFNVLLVALLPCTVA